MQNRDNSIVYVLKLHTFRPQYIFTQRNKDTNNLATLGLLPSTDLHIYNPFFPPQIIKAGLLQIVALIITFFQYFSIPYPNKKRTDNPICTEIHVPFPPCFVFPSLYYTMINRKKFTEWEGCHSANLIIIYCLPYTYWMPRVCQSDSICSQVSSEDNTVTMMNYLFLSFYLNLTEIFKFDLLFTTPIQDITWASWHLKCLFNNLFRLITTKNPNLAITGPLGVESTTVWWNLITKGQRCRVSMSWSHGDTR